MKMKKLRIAGILSLACMLSNLLLQAQQNIYVNQIGYFPESPKYVYVDSPADSFAVINTESGQMALKGKLKLRSAYDSISGFPVYEGEFTQVKESGRYLIQVYFKVNSGITSYPFQISDQVYGEMIHLANKSLYLQRCGIEMEKEYAGKYARKICHLDDASYHHTAALSGAKDVTGGWHDAGDYGKYIAPGSSTIARYYLAYALSPEAMRGDNWGIPESGNETDDVLDEMKYELDWMFKMQRDDGAVHEKVHSKEYVEFVMPSEGHLPRYIYQVSSTATADFAAIMAWSYRMFSETDPDYADKCFDAASKAYAYLEKHPEIFPEGGFRNPSDTKAGGYSDSYDKDERLWAAAEMYISTGKKKYHNDFVELNKLFGNEFHETGFSNPSSYGYYSYLLNDFEKDPELSEQIKRRLLARCDEHLEISSSDGFRSAMLSDDYVWGSTGRMLGRAMNHLIAYEISENVEYLHMASEQLNGVLGINAMKTCYVTGVGSRRVLNLHHAPTAADLNLEPIPGIMTGGPNKHLNDEALQNSFDSNTPPAKTYLDNEESYASNENTVNSNALLVFVSAYLSKAYTELGN